VRGCGQGGWSGNGTQHVALGVKIVLDWYIRYNTQEGVLKCIAMVAKDCQQIPSDFWVFH
jgi:hypothetical protein